VNILNKLAFSSALLMTTVTVQAALDSSEGTDYANTVSDSWVDSGPAADSLQMVNFLLCVLEKSNTAIHVNETYSSMIDENDCNGVAADSPAFATQVATTSRADNSSPFIMKSWFVTAEGMQVVVEVSIISSATTALPRGVVSLTWHAVAPVGSIGTKGSLSTNADGTLVYQENITDDGGSSNRFSYIHGTLAADGTSGNLRVQSQDWSSGSQVDKVYTYVFDANNVHYDTAPQSADVCLDRTEANMTTRTFGYKLFTEAGAEKVISGPFDFSYTDASSVVQRGWASPNGAWLQGNETGANKPTTITRNSNSKVYSICYDDDWDISRDDGFDDTSLAACGSASDDISIQLVHATEGVYTFEPALEFDPLIFTDKSSGVSVTAASPRYQVAGSNLDLGWECKLPSGVWTTQVDHTTCGTATNWRPAYAVPSGTKLKETSTGTEYYIKALNSMTTLAAASSGSCAAIPLTGAPAHAGYTSGSIPAVTTTWADMPTVPDANVMKVIHGVEQ
jgi:hypothetical protein